MSKALINSHGPFTFVFKDNCKWMENGIEVEYGVFDQVDFTHKVLMFESEQEIWFENDVVFDLSDVDKIIIRENSPGFRIHPRKHKKIEKELLKYQKLVEIQQ